MPPEPTRDELREMQRVHDVIEKDKDKELERIFSGPESIEELIRRLSDAGAETRRSEVSEYIWSQPRSFAATMLGKLASTLR
jgi:hypothetical protein